MKHELTQPDCDHDAEIGKLMADNETLGEEVEALEAENEKLRAKIDRLERE